MMINTLVDGRMFKKRIIIQTMSPVSPNWSFTNAVVKRRVERAEGPSTGRARFSPSLSLGAALGQFESAATAVRHCSRTFSTVFPFLAAPSTSTHLHAAFLVEFLKSFLAESHLVVVKLHLQF